MSTSTSTTNNNKPTKRVSAFISNKANSTIAQSSNVESTTSALSTTSSLVSEFAEGMQNH
ncbi:4425_t:CDS:2, partial [Entrophospora sp. SA101]